MYLFLLVEDCEQVICKCLVCRAFTMRALQARRRGMLVSDGERVVLTCSLEWVLILSDLKISGEVERMIRNRMLGPKELSSLLTWTCRSYNSPKLEDSTLSLRKISASDKQQKHICFLGEPTNCISEVFWELTLGVSHFGGEEINWITFQVGLGSEDWLHILTAVLWICQLLLNSCYKSRWTVRIADFPTSFGSSATFWMPSSFTPKVELVTSILETPLRWWCSPPHTIVPFFSLEKFVKVLWT